MNFDNIAELVHELAKSPNRSSVIIPEFKSFREITNCELNAITKVFSKEELSSNALAARMSPTLFWF
ncbi:MULTISPECIES: hypothetical protein [Desulfosporosinus]|uniref:Uncharacterized protein n=1 Tax=Desulfosporosinus nitroreducens TaxID=2018668 RepID=A0ABT8QSK5_9FIRM|nr:MULTISPECIES: hypothetical protein [Desulfosporosinus]MCO1603680.1 hypothetical protein [Desulfosporosinus nitroreducens]MCO5388425.1 hypothetical protein [Desulfosporosinus sp.]MDA8220902.1 hypothetical protein [Desulfitobacterium hafniense]MDO0824302.1 hypothetical protein [Desulfosporosinus nitroreducens]